MKTVLEKIRIPQKEVSLKKQVMVTIGIIFVGASLGVLQKWMDGSPDNIFPIWIQQLDIKNFFGRLAIWILSATGISVYSRSPLRASINTFFFFISMLSGYYLYCHHVLGFLPRTYMMIWVVISGLSFFLAYVCWYAKGEGMIGVVISGGILGVLFAQAFSLTKGFYVYDLMEVIVWMIGILILYRKPKEFIFELGLSVLVAFLYQSIMPYWG